MGEEKLLPAISEKKEREKMINPAPMRSNSVVIKEPAFGH
jgi:hypothetical protein